MTESLYDRIAAVLTRIGENRAKRATPPAKSAFEEVALVGEDGLVICSWGRGGHVDLLNLISLQLQTPIAELRRDSSGVELDEILATSVGGMKYCFRFFLMDGVDYVLAAVFPRSRPYRRATKNAIGELTGLLS